MRKPYVSLFAENRLSTDGNKLTFYDQDEGPIKLGEKDIQGSDCQWERYLVGYFGGEIPREASLKPNSSLLEGPSLYPISWEWMDHFQVRIDGREG